MKALQAKTPCHVKHHKTRDLNNEHWSNEKYNYWSESQKIRDILENLEGGDNGNMNISFTETGWGGMDCIIWLRIGCSGRHL
jgi:hypothetical protein